MKKKLSFEKKINFPTMIGEVCSISLEHNLKFINESNIEGNLLLNGKYKLTEASRLEEAFNYEIPIEIELTEKLDLNTTKIEITDFYYDIENDDIMNCHVELMIEGLELIEDLEENNTEERECDGDNTLNQEIEIPVLDTNEKLENKEDKKDDKKDDDKTNIEKRELEKDEEILEDTVKTNEEEKDTSLFLKIDDDKDTYGTFLVYIVRQNETINSIIEKYNTSLEEIEKYNDIKDLNIGTKLIIPLLNE